MLRFMKSLGLLLIVVVVLSACGIDSYRIPARLTSTIWVTDFENGASLPGADTIFTCPGHPIKLFWQIDSSDFTTATLGTIEDPLSQHPHATVLYTLNNSTPLCPEAAGLSTPMQGCVSVTPTKTTIYTLTVEKSNGPMKRWTLYQAVVNVVGDIAIYNLIVHNTGTTPLWSASVQHVDPDIFVKQARLHPAEPNTIAESGAGVDLWEITNLDANQKSSRISGTAATSTQFPLLGHYALYPLDRTTNQILPVGSVDTSKSLSIDLTLQYTNVRRCCSSIENSRYTVPSGPPITNKCLFPLVL